MNLLLTKPDRWRTRENIDPWSFLHRPWTLSKGWYFPSAVPYERKSLVLGLPFTGRGHWARADIFPVRPHTCCNIFILSVVCVSGCVSWVHVRTCCIVHLGHRDSSSWSELYNDGRFFIFQDIRFRPHCVFVSLSILKHSIQTLMRFRKHLVAKKVVACLACINRVGGLYGRI